MASILGAETGQMTLSALFNPLTILSCALLAVYIGFRVAAYKNHGIDCRMDAVFFIALSWIFFMLFCLATFFTTVLFLEDFRGLRSREFCSLLLVTAVVTARRTLKGSEYKLSVFYERKDSSKTSIDKILIYSVLAFAAIVAVFFSETILDSINLALLAHYAKFRFAVLYTRLLATAPRKAKFEVIITAFELKSTFWPKAEI